MLFIRKSQLLQIAFIHFENRLMADLKAFFPRHCKSMGDEQTHRLIKYGIQRAKRHGLETERELYIYIGLMLMLGSHFDEDIQLPWVGEIFKDNRLSTPYVKIEKIQDTALAYLDHVWGVQDEHFKRALARLRSIQLASLTPQSERMSKERMMAILKNIHPEKFSTLSESNINLLLQNGAELAQHHQLTTTSGIIIYIGLMFVLGGGFSNDPQFPWAAEALGRSNESPEARAIALYQAALTQLETCVSYQGE